MIETILRQSPRTDRERVAAWRQLSDIMAQRGQGLDGSTVLRALHALSWLRGHVPEATRRATAVAIAGRCDFAPLVAFYAGDTPGVASAILGTARLDDDGWLAYLPSSTPGARATLRARNDLSPAVHRALRSFGDADLCLSAPPEREADAPQEMAPAPVAAAPDPRPADTASSQIRRLVERIDAYRARREADQSAAPLPVADAPVEPVDRFSFATGPDGVIATVAGAPRAALIGLSLAEAAYGAETGVDAAVAGAFRRRGEMIDARLNLGASSTVGGEWRFSAVPQFEPASGQFLGYRGTARRPAPHESARVDAAAANGDSVRQLIHELRSPLNAISGFAQIIEAQMFGPVAASYQQMASTIRADAARLQSVIEDMELASRTWSEAPDATSAWLARPVDLNRVIDDSIASIRTLLNERQVVLAAPQSTAPRAVLGDADDLHRMVQRLFGALVAVAGSGETLAYDLSSGEGEGGHETLSIDRPAQLRGVADATLLDPGYSPAGDAPGAAMLSLGFTLRLVANLARQQHGKLTISAERLTLHLRSANAGHRLVHGAWGD